ncbi:MAG: 5'-methylthioadenosine/adenosylhomocysteine nucleosidase [Clostridiales bacterium]|nr:5'-methylthioadenosine/adenosylhomocysteine nucleosidase [Clostridiales bacterium]MCI6589191.1 5'-methylthioadenosine/adenosylhomocysteine nucleosidase [Clostridiales bacterium]MDY3763181.1 5'-methylthioadenosine/adenosylhomocysteine nucleosidase [Candidatus Ventricola sp.]MDY3831348.1 5'-methylthioadenosine/adenosylhomocysteine nucleosidase [Candidatus Ventricola sp.]MDY4855121.1 5'-methylthioadenosine/adenosylhomocysteine nucleosidase [Candidatus Ventricola sp.]
MIGIIAAMDVEMKSLRSYMENTETEVISGIRFVRGTLEGKDVVTAVCGIGKVFAALCAQTMILHYQPRCIINTGVAGTLTDALTIGSIAVSSAVVQHDMDTSPLGDPVGLISGINKVELPADRLLTGQLSACAKVMGIKTATGVIASGDQFVASAERKAFIVEHFKAIACEMEGAAVGQVCYVNKVPFCVLRAISDSADGSSHMDYPTFVQMAAEQSVALLRRFMRC